MDPHFSVLLGDENKGECDSKIHKNKALKMVAIIIPVSIVGVIVLGAGAMALVYPR